MLRVPTGLEVLRSAAAGSATHARTGRGCNRGGAADNRRRSRGSGARSSSSKSSPTARGSANSVRSATFGIEAQGRWAAHVRIARIRIRTAARCPTKVSMRRLHEPKDGYTEVREERHRDQQGGQGIHGRGTSGDEGERPGAEGGCAPRP